MRGKPQGRTGPIQLGGGSAQWLATEFPDNKAEREQLLENLFVKGFERWVATESEPSLGPFGTPSQNDENDLDFTVTTAAGDMLMELAEFAPLKQHGPTFESAPASLDPKEKAKLATALVHKKSKHQGGADRFLVLYVTEHGFWLDPFAIEKMRQLLAANPPAFERVYYVSVHSLTDASVSEIYPGKPHHLFGELTDEQFDEMQVSMPHPTEWVRLPLAPVLIKPQRISVHFKLEIEKVEHFGKNGP